MSTIPIYEDQENRIPDLHQQKGANEMAVQQKRPVLAAINNQRERPLKSKQPLGNANTKSNNEKALNKQNTQKVPAPVVPVAQFEAFKVYEDSQIEEINKRLQRLKKKNACDVYKGTDEDRYVTKREIELMLEQRKQQEAILPLPPVEKISLDPPHCRDSPMSIEKTCEPPQRETAPVKTHASKDLFFEMEEYREQIYKYLRVHETHNRPKSGYMRKQPDIDANMRAILIDWLVEVAEEYRLQTETLYLAVNFIDRFLSYMSVVRAKLQLVGTAAMFIASKYEEICPPAVSEFVYITDNTYKKEQVLRMEHLILKVLSFDLSIPTPLTFITAISIAVKLDRKTMCFALYLTELSMLEVEHYLHTLPSVLASSAIAVARHILGEIAWSEQLQNMTGYKLSELQETVTFLGELAVKAPNMAQQAIQEKYKSLKFLHVAKIPVAKVDIKFDCDERQ